MLTNKNNKTLYEQDFYLWTQTTVKLLQEGKLEELDITNLIEEIDSMGRSEKKELKNRLIILIEHLSRKAEGRGQEAEGNCTLSSATTVGSKGLRPPPN